MGFKMWLEWTDYFLLLANVFLLIGNWKERRENIIRAALNREFGLKNVEHAEKNQAMAQKLRRIELQFVGLKGEHLEGH